MLNLYDADGKIQFEKDRGRPTSTSCSTSTRTRCSSTTSTRSWTTWSRRTARARVLERYNREFIRELFGYAYRQKFRFPTFLGAFKYYTSYAEDLRREALPGALRGPCLHGGADAGRRRRGARAPTRRRDHLRPVPAGHADLPELGKKQRGEPVSCFLLRIEDDMESIGRSINSALQLSKRGGGVACC